MEDRHGDSKRFLTVELFRLADSGDYFRAVALRRLLFTLYIMAKAKQTSSASKTSTDNMPKIVHHIMEDRLVASIREDHRICIQRPWRFGAQSGFTNWLRPNDMATVGSILDQYTAWCESHPIPSDEPASQAKKKAVATAAA